MKNQTSRKPLITPEHIPFRRTKADPVKFIVFGEEIIEKKVNPSGNSGRVYLPPDWVGHKIKIVRLD